MLLASLSLRARSFLIMAVPLVALVSMMGLFGLAYTKTQAARDTILRAGNALGAGNELLIALVDAETGVRGYVIGQRRDFLEPYERAYPAIALTSDRLADAVRGDPLQLARAAKLRALTNDALRLLTETIYLQSKSHEAAVRAVAGGESKAAMDRFRALLAELLEEERRSRAARLREAAQTWRMIAWAGVGVGVTSFIFALLATRLFVLMIVRRLLALQSKAARFAAGQPLGAPLQGNDELVAVDHAFHAMAAEREAIEAALGASRDQAMEASRAKSQFLATMSHEIRTPMNGVIGMSDLLLETDLSSNQRELAETVVESGRALLSIINNILDFSKLEAGKFDLELLDFYPLQVIESAADLLALQAAGKELSLMTYIAPDVPRLVLGDAGRLRQVLLNLLGNAIKFTHQGGVAVSLHVASHAGNTVVLRFEVTDSGVGLEQQQIEKLFEPFTQVDASTTRVYGGTGLGLSICKRLIELMNGEIGLTSMPGCGTTCWFTLPFERRNAQEVGDVYAPRSIDIAHLRTLVVDDDPVARSILSRYLTSWGMQNTCASSAGEALRLLSEAAAAGQPFQVAILDFLMPAMNGAELARAIRENPAIAQTRLLLVSAHGHLFKELQAEGLGFAAFLRKPVRQSQLFDAIASAVGEGLGAPQERVQTPSIKQQRVDNSANCPPILLVEDHPINQRLALLQLEGLGLAVDVVGNGREAYEAFTSRSYSLILMDCQMPVMDGFEATRTIRRSEIATGKRIPIIAMTANAMASDRDACIMAGMDDYITKPVTADALESVLRRWVNMTAAT